MRSATPDSRAASRNAVGEPGFLAGQYQAMLELWIGAHQAGKGLDEADLILARLQVTDREHKGSGNFEVVADGCAGSFARNRPEFGSGGIGDHHDLVLIQIAVDLQDGPAREFAAGEDPGGAMYGAAYGPLQLVGARPRKVLRVLEKTDVVDADDYRDRTGERSRILNVQKVGPIFAHSVRQIITEAHEGVA